MPETDSITGQETIQPQAATVSPGVGAENMAFLYSFLQNMSQTLSSVMSNPIMSGEAFRRIGGLYNQHLIANSDKLIEKIKVTNQLSENQIRIFRQQFSQNLQLAGSYQFLAGTVTGFGLSILKANEALQEQGARAGQQVALANIPRTPGGNLSSDAFKYNLGQTIFNNRTEQYFGPEVAQTQQQILKEVNWMLAAQHKSEGTINAFSRTAALNQQVTGIPFAGLVNQLVKSYNGSGLNVEGAVTIANDLMNQSMSGQQFLTRPGDATNMFMNLAKAGEEFAGPGAPSLKFAGKGLGLLRELPGGRGFSEENAMAILRTMSSIAAPSNDEQRMHMNLFRTKGKFGALETQKLVDLIANDPAAALPVLYNAAYGDRSSDQASKYNQTANRPTKLIEQTLLGGDKNALKALIQFRKQAEMLSSESRISVADAEKQLVEMFQKSGLSIKDNIEAYNGLTKDITALQPQVKAQSTLMGDPLHALSGWIKATKNTGIETLTDVTGNPRAGSYLGGALSTIGTAAQIFFALRGKVGATMMLEELQNGNWFGGSQAGEGVGKGEGNGGMSAVTLMALLQAGKFKTTKLPWKNLFIGPGTPAIPPTPSPYYGIPDTPGQPATLGKLTPLSKGLATAAAFEGAYSLYTKVTDKTATNADKINTGLATLAKTIGGVAAWVPGGQIVAGTALATGYAMDIANNLTKPDTAWHGSKGAYETWIKSKHLGVTEEGDVYVPGGFSGWGSKMQYQNSRGIRKGEYPEIDIVQEDIKKVFKESKASAAATNDIAGTLIIDIRSNGESIKEQAMNLAIKETLYAQVSLGTTGTTT